MTALAVAEAAEWRAVLYGRQSKDLALSIGDQLADGADRAEMRGWAVVSSLSDGVSASRYSGRTRDDWPVLLRLVESRQVNVVWLWEASRGERRASQWLSFLELCQEHAVAIYVEKDGRDGRFYDLDTAQDWKVMANAGVDAQGESDLMRERVMRRKNRARRHGELKVVLGGRARYGWSDPGPKQAWVLDEHAARVLADVAARLLAGQDLLPIYETLTASGPLLDSYGNEVNYKRLRATLRMPVTAGLMTDEDGQPVLDRTGKPAAPAQDGPLDPDTWFRLQTVFAARKRGRRTTAAYPLGRLLVCGECGNQLTGEINGAPGLGYYACSTPHKDTGHANGCRKVFVQAEEVHDEVRAALTLWAANSPRAKRLAETRVDDSGRRVALLAERAVLQERMADLVDKRDRGRITPSRFQQAEAVLEAGFVSIERELATVEQAAVAPLPVDVEWDAMTSEERRRLVERVFVTPIIVLSRAQAGSRKAADRFELSFRE